MNLNREQELLLFRNVNGINKKWDNKSSGKSFFDSSSELYLRLNQGKARAKFIKSIVRNNSKERIVKGVKVGASDLQ